MDIAAAAHENGTPEQLVHQQLLDQLARVPEVGCVGFWTAELFGTVGAKVIDLSSKSYLDCYLF
jgi:hypothetical protein